VRQIGHQDQPDLVIRLGWDENFRQGKKSIIQQAHIQAAPAEHANVIDIVSLGKKSETRGHAMQGLNNQALQSENAELAKTLNIANNLEVATEKAAVIPLQQPPHQRNHPPAHGPAGANFASGSVHSKTRKNRNAPSICSRSMACRCPPTNRASS
jgi:hypothetical protein